VPPNTARACLIPPPPAFRSSEPALDGIEASAARKGEQEAGSWLRKLKTRETELTTKLTRSKRQAQALGSLAGTRRSTLTRLEQNLIAPSSNQPAGEANSGEGSQRRREQSGEQVCKFKAQVAFESDTDSMAERNSVASSRNSGAPKSGASAEQHSKPQPQPQSQPSDRKKELVSETKFSRSDEISAARAERPKADGSVRSEMGKGAAGISFAVGVQPKWDYSLRVNRMRGNKVDSKVK